MTKKYIAIYQDNKGNGLGADTINGELTFEKLYALEPKAKRYDAKYISIERRTNGHFIAIGIYDVKKGTFYKSGSLPRYGPGLY